MKTIIKSLIFSIFLFLSLNATAQWVNINAPTLNVGNSIYFTANDTGYMVTADFNSGGKIFKTTDGASWSNQLTITDYLFTVHFVSNQLGWAAGGQIGAGIILKTTDGGATWNTLTNNCEQVLSIYFVNDTLGWAAATDATQGTYFIYNTTDGGLNWITQQSGSDYVRSVFFINQNKGWVAGDNGRIYGTTNGGTTWNLLTSGIVCHFNDIQFINDTLGWAVGSYGDGKCFKTIDGGATWVQLTIPTIEPITSLHFISDNIGWICGNNGVVLITYDGGTNWQQEMSSTTNNLNSIHFLNANVGYATGNLGTVIKYTNPVSIKNGDRELDFKIYPNPNKGILNIQVPYILAERIEVELFSVQGNYLVKYFLNPKELNHKIDLSNFANGLYLLKITTLNDIHTEIINVMH